MARLDGIRRVRGRVKALRWLFSHPANRRRRLRGLYRLLAFQVQSRLNGGKPITTPIGRCSQIYAVRGMSASTKAIYGNPPDPGPMVAWQRLLRSGDLFVDIGANVGSYLLIAGEFSVDLVAVEPNGVARKWLHKNLELNSLSARVLDVAVGAAHGSERFSMGRDCTNSFDPRGEQIVTVETLDSIIGQRRAKVKVDVEGFELSVLEGARDALTEQRIEAIQLEMNEDRELICSELGHYGYDLYEATPHGDFISYGGAADLFAFPSSPTSEGGVPPSV